MENEKLKFYATNVRKDILTEVHAAQSGHPGGSLGAADLLTALYFDEMDITEENLDSIDRDRFVLSKGHASPLLYAVLCEKGFMKKEELLTFRQINSRLQGHPNMNYLPGVDMSTGSLGQGVSAAVGRNAFSRYTESQIPVVGTVRAGYGALAFEEDYGKEYACVKDPKNYFFLVVKGDSMEPRISDGDLALVHRQPTLENGDLGVMVYGDEGEGTLKKYVLRGNAVVLQPFNPAYEPKVLRGEELDKLFIAGKVVETKAKW